MEQLHGQNAPLCADTNLHRRYTLREVTAQTEYETVYRAFDYVARQEVSVRKFFPRSLAARAEGSSAVSPRFRSLGALFFLASEAYVRQYGTLTQALGSPNLLSVFEAFFENGTAYAVTERLSGATLTDYLAMEDRLLLPGEAVYIAEGVSDALLVIHSLSILHHDISPDTIWISTDGTVKLTDFGAGKRTVLTRHEVDESRPSSDIRALGAALYAAVTGRDASDQPDVPAGATLPESLREMLERMLSPDPGIRFQSVFELRYAAYAQQIPTIAPAVTPARIAAWRQRASSEAARKSVVEAPLLNDTREADRPVDMHKGAPGGPERRGVLLTVCGVLLLLLAGLAAALYMRFSG